MSLMLDQEKIIFNGKVIGKMKWDGANTQVHFTLKYKASPDDAIVPISYLATGLAIILNKKPSGPQIAVTSSEDDVRWVKRAVRTLTEKPVTRDGLFHKNHADHWP